MGRGNRRRRIYPRAQNTAYCMGRLFKQRPRYSAIDAGLQHRLSNFRIASIKETLGKRIDLRIEFNEFKRCGYCQKCSLNFSIPT